MRDRAEGAHAGRRRTIGALGWLLLLVAACRFDPAYRDAPPGPTRTCDVGAIACHAGSLARCDGDADAQRWTAIDDCGARGLVCVDSLARCALCSPAATRCDGLTAQVCSDDGSSWSAREACDGDAGFACRSGSCVSLCGDAANQHSNVGCEYWAVDLDNAVVSSSLSAASQPFAIVLSNAQPDVVAHVVVEVDDAAPGEAARLRTVGTATVTPRNLEVFSLGSREVDGSSDGTYDTGTGTALTRHAFRIRASVPIVAYQFNPLDNVDVFSNDASQLLPTSALDGKGEGHGYVVASWPQTIAKTTDPSTNFGMDLRTFLAIVGTRPDTHVRVRPTARIIPGGPFPQGIEAGSEVTATLQPFEVLNLETGDFNADLTGTFVDSDAPVAIFPGSEASDAPYFSSLSDRRCCADHLEEQGIPVRAAGQTYVLAHVPNRTEALVRAGATIGTVPEPVFYRVVATRAGTTHVTTSLPPPDDAFDLSAEGEHHDLTSADDFTLSASEGVVVAEVQASQDAAGVPRGLPGGDPSLTFVPPVEQWRTDYVLLTPDKYAFDFLVLMAPSEAKLYLDGQALGRDRCEIHDTDGKSADQRGAPASRWLAYRCQLSFPTLDPATSKLAPGLQNDGVHRLQADYPIGVVVYGFDSYVSYAYPGGTELREINVK